MRKSHFFCFFCVFIWSYQKKVVLLHSLSVKEVQFGQSNTTFSSVVQLLLKCVKGDEGEMGEWLKPPVC